MKRITIEVPDGCEVKIVGKEISEKPVIKTYQDLINNAIRLDGYYIDFSSKIQPRITEPAGGDQKNLAASVKVAKSMLAMAMISQLMPYYGGEITDEEWKDSFSAKFIIKRNYNRIEVDYYCSIYCFLAFHTEKQRDEFLRYNEQLVKDYLMID